VRWDGGWLALLGTGGLLGFFLRPAVDRLFIWFFRPQLAIEFPGAEPGCEVKTSVQGSNKVPTHNYLRVRVRNRGRTTAQKVSIYGTALRQWEPGKSIPIFVFRGEVLDLHRALIGGLEFRLAPRAFQYVELCHVEKGSSSLQWDFEQRPIRLYERSFGPGSYRVHVFASCDNSRSISGDVIFPGTGPSRACAPLALLARLSERMSGHDATP
jgi:hypothetical protein